MVNLQDNCLVSPYGNIWILSIVILPIKKIATESTKIHGMFFYNQTPRHCEKSILQRDHFVLLRADGAQVKFSRLMAEC